MPIPMHPSVRQRGAEHASGAAHGVHSASGPRSHWLRVSCGPGGPDRYAETQSRGKRSSRRVVRKKVVTCAGVLGFSRQE